MGKVVGERGFPPPGRLAGQFPGGANVNLEPPNHHSGALDVEITPGSYGDVTVKRDRNLVLVGSGDYFFDKLEVDARGRVRIQASSSAGPVRIFVKSSVNLQGPLSGNTNQILIGLLGNGGVAVNSDTGVTATIVAPNASISLEPGRRVFGALIGSYVTIHQDSELAYNEFLYNWCPGT